MDLTDAQWQVVAPLLPVLPPPGRGRPPREGRAVLNGILWKLRTGEPWYDLPPSYPSHQTCYRYYIAWQRSGLLDEVLHRLSEHLRQNGGFDLDKALHKDHTIKVVSTPCVIRVETKPRYPDTWQASTAWLMLSISVLHHHPGENRITYTAFDNPKHYKQFIRWKVERLLTKRLRIKSDR
jgi:transposase